VLKILIKHWTLFSGIILALGAGWIGLSAALLNPAAQSSIAAPQRGLSAPDFTLQTLSGETLALSELRGQPVLINFWASWCPPCRAEMPAMQRIYTAYQTQGFVVLAINVTSQDTIENAKAFATENGLTFPIFLDTDGAVSRLYRAESLPTSFFVDRNGIIQEVVIGGPMAEALLRTRVENLLAEAP
jgi:peroxiredoxin